MDVNHFDRILELVSSTDFLNNLSSAGEVPFYISAYKVAKEDLLIESIELLKKKLRTRGIKVLIIDLYEVAINRLTEDDDIEDYFELETSISKKEFVQTLGHALDTEDILIPYIEDLVNKKQPNVVFIIGVGKVFPFIRSHSIVNNLENIINEIPFVLFYPGQYKEMKLSLFDRIKTENHYRAFNIEDIKI